MVTAQKKKGQSPSYSIKKWKNRLKHLKVMEGQKKKKKKENIDKETF